MFYKYENNQVDKWAKIRCEIRTTEYVVWGVHIAIILFKNTHAICHNLVGPYVLALPTGVYARVDTLGIPRVTFLKLNVNIDTLVISGLSYSLSPKPQVAILTLSLKWFNHISLLPNLVSITDNSKGNTHGGIKQKG